MQGETSEQAVTAIRDARVKNNIKPKEPVNSFVQTVNEVDYKPIIPILQNR